MNTMRKRTSVGVLFNIRGRAADGFRSFFLVALVLFLVTALPCSAARITESSLTEKLRLETTTIRGEKLQISLLLRAIGRKAGVNILVDETIVDTVSLDLHDVNLYDLFRLVLETRELRYYEANNALIVEKAADYIKDQRDVITTRLCPRYGQAANHLQELTVLKSGEGSLTVSADGNCVVVRDHEENVSRITKMLAKLDVPVPQVHIKARIVTIDKSISKQLGIKWGYTDLERLPDDSLTSAANLSVVDPTTSIIFGFIRDTFTLDLELSALQERNQLKILSEPRIVVLDGQEAEIKQGQEVPYESGTLENRNTSFREAVLGLKVIPKILQNNYIRLDVKVTNDSVDENNTEDGQPLLNRQEIRTNLFLEDGVTVVVGGILSKGLDETRGEVPWFADLPFVGEIFKSTDKIDKTYELLVFLTPTLLKSKASASGGPYGTIDLLEGQRQQGHNEPTDIFVEEGEPHAVAEPKVRLLLHPLELRETR